MTNMRELEVGQVVASGRDNCNYVITKVLRGDDGKPIGYYGKYNFCGTDGFCYKHPEIVIYPDEIQGEYPIYV